MSLIRVNIKAICPSGPPAGCEAAQPYMATTIQLRRMRIDEAVTTGRLMRKVIRSLPICSARERCGEAAKYTAAVIRALVKDDPDAVLVAVADGHPVGFCVSRRDDGLLLLEWYGVDAAWRANGIGRQLLERVVTTAARRGCHKLWCDSNMGNKASHSLLCGLGFQPFATVKNHWYGEDFILWERPVERSRGRAARVARSPRHARRWSTPDRSRLATLSRALAA